MLMTLCVMISHYLVSQLENIKKNEISSFQERNVKVIIWEKMMVIVNVSKLIILRYFSSNFVINSETLSIHPKVWFFLNKKILKYALFVRCKQLSLIFVKNPPSPMWEQLLSSLNCVMIHLRSKKEKKTKNGIKY